MTVVDDPLERWVWRLMAVVDAAVDDISEVLDIGGCRLTLSPKTKSSVFVV